MICASLAQFNLRLEETVTLRITTDEDLTEGLTMGDVFKSLLEKTRRDKSPIETLQLDLSWLSETQQKNRLDQLKNIPDLVAQEGANQCKSKIVMWKQNHWKKK